MTTTIRVTASNCDVAVVIKSGENESEHIVGMGDERDFHIHGTAIFSASEVASAMDDDKADDNRNKDNL
jgi:hypothetical protein